MKRIAINGESREVQATTVAELLAELGMGDELVAVECNREIVPRARHAEATLKSGDELEIVHFVGGG